MDPKRGDDHFSVKTSWTEAGANSPLKGWEWGDAIFPPPPCPRAQLDFSEQHSNSNPLEAGVTYTKPLPPAPGRSIFNRAGLTVSQCSGPLLQRTSTGPPHVSSLLIIEGSKVSGSVLVETGPSFLFFYFGISIIVFLCLFVCLFVSSVPFLFFGSGSFFFQAHFNKQIKEHLVKVPTLPTAMKEELCRGLTCGKEDPKRNSKVHIAYTKNPSWGTRPWTVSDPFVI